MMNKANTVNCAQCGGVIRLESARWALIAGDTLLYFHGAGCLLAWLQAKVIERRGVAKE